MRGIWRICAELPRDGKTLRCVDLFAILSPVFWQFAPRREGNNVVSALISKSNIGGLDMKQEKLSATQKAAVERIKILMRDYALVMRPSFLYTQKELLKTIEADLSRLDQEYIKKYKIPTDVVKELAGEVYKTLIEKGEYDRAITVAEHYSL